MKYAYLVTFMITVVLCVGCSDDDTGPAPNIDAGADAPSPDAELDSAHDADADVEEPVELRIRPESLRLAEGNTLSVQVYDGLERLELSDVELTTSVPSIASVNSEGLLRALSAGEFELIVRVDDSEARFDGEVLAPEWIDVDVSTRHTCALDANGQVFCAGGFEVDEEVSTALRRGSGKLVPLEHAETFTELALAFRTVCALDTSGRPWCRGRRFQGVDEYGDPVTYANTFELVGVPDHIEFTQLVAGEAHFCALSSTGSVWCWGANFYDQLGHSEYKETPTQVALPGDYKSVTVGDWHTCALSTEGRTFCWGANRAGQLGLGHQNITRHPTAVAFDMPFEQLAAGRVHTCGLQGTDVHCWGLNDSYQLGRDRVRGSWTPVLAATAEVKSIFSSYLSTCAIKQNGDAVCWGTNEQGQLGDDEFLVRQTPRLIEGAKFSQLALSTTHSCGLTIVGELRCWGFDAGGSLAVGRQVAFAEPQQVDTRGGSLDAGALHTCRVVSDTLECWGSNLQYQLGSGRRVATSRPSSIGDGWQDVAAGATTSCAIKGSEVYCWGVEYARELGLTENFNVVRAPTRNNFMGTAESIRMTDSSVMVQGDGQTYWWGADERIDDVRAVIEGATSLDDEYVDIDSTTVGGAHGCGIRRGSDGEAQCWGQRELRGDPSQESTYTHIAYPIDSPHRFDQLAAGRQHTCGLTTEDALHCWGEIIPGQGLVQTPFAVSTSITLETLSEGGAYYGCGLDADGYAYCWGKNFAGALGDGTFEDRAVPTAVAGGIQFRELTLGERHACGVSVDDEVYCWGDNRYGQLGIGGQLYYTSPQPVATAQ